MHPENKKKFIAFEDVPKSRNRLSQLVATNNFIYLIEQLPEKGKNIIVQICLGNSSFKQITPDEFNVFSKVYEYGGGDYTISDAALYFVNGEDQNIYSYVFSTKEIFPITFKKNCRYADLVVAKNNKYLFCVREIHSAKKNVDHEIVAISIDPNKAEEIILLQGRNFYSSPRISLDNKKLAYVCWDHPYMPWDHSELWLLEIDDHLNILKNKRIAGGGGESILEPMWGPEDRLYFISDRNGWYNLYNWCGEGVKELFPFKADFSRPPWKLGSKSYTFVGDNKIAALLTEKGRDFLGIFDYPTFKKLELPWTDYRPFLEHTNNKLYFIASSLTEFPALIELDLNTNKAKKVYIRPNHKLKKKIISKPAEITCLNKEGLDIHAFFYPPITPLRKETLPPLIVNCHGGPTFLSTTGLNLEVQFWTSRGFAFVDVNYSGSAGYGKEYRDRIKGKWGIIDVDDCICIVKYLIKKKIVNPNEVIIRGNSAGGFTALRAACISSIFKGAVSYYGITDLEMLIKETHKFEAYYPNQLIGGYKESKSEYRARSPISKLSILSTPVLFIHGVQDTIVPYSQVEKVIKKRLKNGLCCDVLSLADEGHSINKNSNIILALKKEYEFFCNILGDHCRASST